MTRFLFVFHQFYGKKILNQEELKYLVCYIRKCLNSKFGTRDKYWYNMFAYYLRANEVCKWRQINGFLPLAKWGESISNNKVVNIFKEHKNCCCSKVYF